MNQGRRVYIVDQGKFENAEALAAFAALERRGAIPISSPDEILSAA
jgi:hypothetical protein